MSKKEISPLSKLESCIKTSFAQYIDMEETCLAVCKSMRKSTLSAEENNCANVLRILKQKRQFIGII